MISFKGQKKVGHSPDLPPLGVQFKILDEPPHPFHMGALPEGSPTGFSGCGVCLTWMPGFGILQQNWGYNRFGIESSALDAGRGTSKITFGFTGLNKNVGRNDGIVKPYWRPPT